MPDSLHPARSNRTSPVAGTLVPPAASPREPRAGLLDRVRAHGRAKAFLVSAMMIWLGAPYALLQRVELFAPTQVVRLPLDLRIPFDPSWVWIYFSYYLMLLLPPLFVRRFDSLLRTVVGLAATGFAGFVVFLLFPTVLPRPDVVDPSWGWQLLVTVDRPRNVFPSLHAALAVHAALAAEGLLRELRRDGVVPSPWPGRALLWSWVGAILYSAVATGQHVVLDIAGGACLGVLVWLITWRMWDARWTGRPAGWMPGARWREAALVGSRSLPSSGGSRQPARRQLESRRQNGAPSSSSRSSGPSPSSGR